MVPSIHDFGLDNRGHHGPHTYHYAIVEPDKNRTSFSISDTPDWINLTCSRPPKITPIVPTDEWGKLSQLSHQEPHQEQTTPRV